MSRLQQWKQPKLNLGPIARVAPDLSSERFIASRLAESPTGEPRLLESILEPENMQRALHRVVRNDGAPGIDKVTVRQMARYYRRHREEIHSDLLHGTYVPSAARASEIPKEGGTRQLGIPIALDRLVAQATSQVLSAVWNHTFSNSTSLTESSRSAVCSMFVLPTTVSSWSEANGQPSACPTPVD